LRRRAASANQQAMKAPFLGLTALLLPAGCGDVAETSQKTPAAAETGEERVDCAPAGTGEFQRACTIERLQSARGTILTVRHPDGGFRRLLVTTDGRGVIAADGAERAVVSLIRQDRIEVALAGHRYRLPATVKRD
jgi:hypothetical protein